MKKRKQAVLFSVFFIVLSVCIGISVKARFADGESEGDVVYTNSEDGDVAGITVHTGDGTQSFVLIDENGDVVGKEYGATFAKTNSETNQEIGATFTVADIEANSQGDTVVTKSYSADEITLEYTDEWNDDGEAINWKTADEAYGKISDGADNQIVVYLYQDVAYRLVKNASETEEPIYIGVTAVDTWFAGQANATSDNQVCEVSVIGDSYYFRDTEWKRMEGSAQSFYFYANTQDSVSNSYSVILEDETEITGTAVGKYINVTDLERASDSGLYGYQFTVTGETTFRLCIAMTVTDGDGYAYTVTRGIDVQYIPTGLAVTSNVWNDEGEVVGFQGTDWNSVDNRFAGTIYEDTYVQFVEVSIPEELTFDEDGNPNLKVTALAVEPDDFTVTYGGKEVDIDTEHNEWETIDRDIVIKKEQTDSGVTYYILNLRHVGEYTITYDEQTIDVQSILPAVGLYKANEQSEENLINGKSTTLSYDDSELYVFLNPQGWWESAPDINDVEIKVEKFAHEDEDFSSFIERNGNQITLTENAYGNFTLYAKAALTHGTGEDAWTEEYEWSVGFSAGNVPTFEDGRPQCGFSGIFVSEDAYNTTNFWSVDREFDYWVHAESLQEVIDTLIAEAAEGKTLTDESTGKTYTVKNTGYIWTTASYCTFDEQYLANGTAPQYVTTPSGEEGIKGIVMNAGSEYFYIEVPEEDETSTEGTQTDAGEVRYCPVIDFVKVADNSQKIQLVEYGWDEEKECSLYRYLQGDYDEGFTLTNDTKQYSEDDLLENGYRIADGEQTMLECAWPEVHVDATTPVKIIGNFQEPEKDKDGNPKANLYIGLYKDSDIVSKVATSVEDYDDNAITISAKDIGKEAQMSEVLNVCVTVQELTTTTETAVAEDDFLTKDGITFETGTGEKALRDKMNIENVVAKDEQVKEDIITGTPLEVSLNVKSVKENNTELAADIGKIADFAKNDKAMRLQYLDIGLQYKIGKHEDKVTETNGDIAISMKLPDTFARNGKIPVIYRCHDGKVETLEATYKDGIITFKTSRFSTYAVGVEDSSQETTQTTEPPKTTETTEISKTTDNTPSPQPIAVGDTQVVNGSTYEVTSVEGTQKTVAYVSGAVNATSVAIPATVTIDGTTYTVTAIKANAFAGRKKLTKVSIPNTVTTIGNNAFKNCVKLKSITIPLGVKAIGSNAFYGCKKLKSVAFKGKAITKIGAGAFQKCSALKSVTLPKSVVDIGKNAFNGCKSLKKVTIKGTKLKTVGKNAFYNIAKKSTIKVPKSKRTAYKKLLKKSGYKKTVK